MAKRTAIIDIGSNSARMAIYEKTSRFGFHLINEVKSRVRVGEGAYEKGGVLQQIPMERTYKTLEEFNSIVKNLKCKKTLCVATSALRDAPNAKELTSKVKQNLKLDIKIIDGKKEAYYGGVAALNLLFEMEEFISIDIGGGSTELALVKNGKIQDTISLNIGTVRIKELFFDSKKPFELLKAYLQDAISVLPKHFRSSKVCGIGGTLRALSSAIMESQNYPLQTVHGFEYEFCEYEEYIKNIALANVRDLSNYPFKKDRYDTIREGCAIFYTLAKHLGAKDVVSSGAGVREGVYLCDLLRSSSHKFPANFNLSIKSLTDRFVQNPKDNLYIHKQAGELFEVLKPLHGIDGKYKKSLQIAAKLYNVGQSLSFYQQHQHGYHFIISNLNFGFCHKEKILIALLVKYHHKKLPKGSVLSEFESILPDTNIVKWLSFILSLAKSLNTNLCRSSYEFSYDNKILNIASKNPTKLAQEASEKLIKPSPFAIRFKQL